MAGCCWGREGLLPQPDDPANVLARISVVLNVHSRSTRRGQYLSSWRCDKADRQGRSPRPHVAGFAG
eukprot:11132634-Heterocapsa_arctica.AAC.1